MNETPKTKPCIACQAEIPEKATICQQCKTRQNSKFNFLQNIGAVIGAISAILAFGSYVISSLPAVRQTLWWKDSINVLTYSDRQIVIGNNGDGEVFVSHIFIQSRPHNKVVRINQTVKPGEFIVNETELLTGGSWRVVSGVTDEEWSELLRNESRDRASTTAGCIIMEFVSASDPGFQNYQYSLGDKLRIVEGDATVYYYSNKYGTELSDDFPVYGLLYRNPNSCADSLVQK